jgi:glycosyltransferase involved in cell wall biosynthesis
VVTLHDVVSWEYPDEAPPVRAAVSELRSADAVICVSAYSAQRAAEVLGIQDAVVIPNGVDARFYDAGPLPDDELAKLGVHGRFVITTGGASLRKNLGALADAWPRIRSAHPDLQLVLTGPEHPRRTELFAGLDGVVLTGRLPTRALPALMAAASALVIPSTTEGFGLPALEAMACRTPVVAARSSALPEVVGDAGVLVPPDAAGVADGVLDVLAGGADIAAMITRGRARAGEFTWERCAAAHAAVWARVA